MNPLVKGSPSLDLRGHFINGEVIHEWASTITTILQVIQYTISYGPMREWASIFTQVLQVVQCNINYGLIHQCESVFAKLQQVVKYTVNYGPIHSSMGIQLMQP